MAYCPHCGAQNPDGATFCARCGQPLAPPVQNPGYYSAPNPQPAPQPAPVPQQKKRSVWYWILIVVVGLAFLAMKMGW